MINLLMVLSGLFATPGGQPELWASLGHYEGPTVRMLYGPWTWHYGSRRIVTATGRYNRKEFYWRYGVFLFAESAVSWEGIESTLMVAFHPFEGFELSIGLELIRLRLVGSFSMWVQDLPKRKSLFLRACSIVVPQR